MDVIFFYLKSHDQLPSTANYRVNKRAIMKNVQLIWAHPRTDSVTARVVDGVREELIAAGMNVSELDLYRSGFEAAMGEADEPDWGNIDKAYSNDVQKLGRALRAQDAVVFVFPVWWFSVPAILKGYIDRVWNFGIAYGGGLRLPFKTVRWIAVTGESEKTFTKRGLDKSMTHQLNVGIAGLCGAEDSKVEYLFDVLGEEVTDLPTHHAALIEQARQTVRDIVQEH